MFLSVQSNIATKNDSIKLYIGEEDNLINQSKSKML